jgi:hypothetical protein
MVYAFDTLGYAKRLRDSGVSQAQAEAHAEAARDFVMGQLVTQQDLQAAVALIDNKLASLDNKFDNKLALLDNKFDNKLALLDNKLALLDNKLDTLSLRLTVRLGAMIVVAIGLLATILKLMP